MKKLITTVLSSAILFVMTTSVFAKSHDPIEWQTTVAGKSGQFQTSGPGFALGKYAVTCSIVDGNNLTKDQWIMVSFNSFYPPNGTGKFTSTTSRFKLNNVMTKNICNASGCYPELTMYYNNSVNTIVENVECKAVYVAS